MKRLLILSLVLGLIAGSLATAEAKKTNRKRVQRTVKGSYSSQFVPMSGLVRPVCDGQEEGNGCVAIQTRAKESSFTANVTDTHGRPVYVKVHGPTPPDDDPAFESNLVYGSFCGETQRPISFDPGVDLYFFIGYFFT